jgi:hypothetical protein
LASTGVVVTEVNRLAVVRWWVALLGVVLAALVVVFASPAKKHRLVPYGFVGVMADGPVLDGSTNAAAEFDLMAQSGAESVRLSFDWATAQPYRSVARVPPERRARFRNVGGTPTDFSTTDRVVSLATARGMEIMPVVIHAPNWAARHPGVFASPPKSNRAYGQYAAALVRRYGPDGSFWIENPKLPRAPLRQWQIWNEPNGPLFWSDRRHAERDYLRLLRTARTYVKRADGGARVVLAGLFGRGYLFLEQLYRRGGGALFDRVGLAPFTLKVRNVVVLVERAHAVMRRHGDGSKPLLLTETSWPSARGVPMRRTFGYETTEKGQAAKLRALFRSLAARREQLRLGGIYFYTWMGRERDHSWPFDYSGLRRLELTGRTVSKPALKAYQQTAWRLDGCVKSAVATRCR